MNTRGSVSGSTLNERVTGVVYIHSAPAAVCPHVEWALSSALTQSVDLQWTAQTAAPGALRAECEWIGDAGTGARLAAVLRTWSMLRFEVTEDASTGVDGQRFCHVPGLGLWQGSANASGDIVVGEQHLRAMLAQYRTSEGFARRVDELLGTAWDEALEPFRHAGEGAPVTWLHQVG